MLNDVTFERNKSGLGSPLESQDHVSAIIFYNATLPSGFDTDDRVKTVFSIEEAEDLGIIEGSVNHSAEWYHIREYFEKNPKGELFVGFYAVPAVVTTADFDELVLIQNFAEGRVRQAGIFYPHSPLTVGLVNSIQAKVLELQTIHKPLNVLFGCDIQGTADLTTLPDLRTLNAQNVSVLIGQDHGAKGKAIFTATSKSVTDLGSKLGAVSAASVHESIGWLERFPMITDGYELDKIAFANGQDYKVISQGLLEALDTKGYLFLVKHVGYAGTFNNDSYTSVAKTSDLATIENNRVIDKAVRNVRAFILPKLGSPLYVQADGKLTQDTIAMFKALASRGLSSMNADGEVSTYGVLIDADQDILTTSLLTITVEIVPVGVNRSTKINIGFVPKLQTS